MMSKHAGIARFTYNWGLATWNNLFKDGLKPNKYILKKFFNNHVKPEFDWIKEKGSHFPIPQSQQVKEGLAQGALRECHRHLHPCPVRQTLY